MDLNCISVVTPREKQKKQMFICFHSKVICGFCMPVKMQGCYIQSHVRDLTNEIVTDILENLSQNALMDNASHFSLSLHTCSTLTEILKLLRERQV